MFSSRLFVNILFIFLFSFTTSYARVWREKTFQELHTPKWSYFNDPQIYGPLAAALILSVTDQHGKISDWASRERPIINTKEKAGSTGDGPAFYLLGS
jgi:hypothetical protein